jgi:hypothetical protein
MAKKHVDPLKAKQRKQKIIAGVLGVVFVGLMAFQVPRLMKQLHPAPPPQVHHASATATPTTGTPTLAAPTLAGGNATPTPATGTDSSLASSAAPAVQEGQLASFSLFASKDPFAQQISDEKSSTGSTSSSSSGSSSGASGGGSGSGVSGGKAPTPGSAVISVNGTLYSVAVGADFPQASSTDPSIVPLFHLVSVTAHTAKISIVGGSYANGAPTVTLTENKPLTLMNTADSTRYKLILKPVGTAVPTAPAPTSTSPTTTVPVPPPSSP